MRSTASAAAPVDLITPTPACFLVSRKLGAGLALGSPAYGRLVAALSWRRASHRGSLTGSENAATFRTRSRWRLKCRARKAKSAAA